MIDFIKKIYLSEKGATAIEYGLIVAFIALAIIGAVSALGNQTGNTFSAVSKGWPDAPS